MKKFFALILCCAIFFSITACGGNNDSASDNFTVPSPMETKLYALDDSPSTEELRKTAVQAMADLLSIQWCTDVEIGYYKSGPASRNHFEHAPGNIYAGNIYSDASAGLFQFMEFYDQQTGKLVYPGPVSEMKKNIGSACADTLLWGWSAVCNSITGGFFPNFMVYNNGYIPLGDYFYDYNINSFLEFPTNKIITFNGNKTICACYALVGPADALISSTDNHAMMAIEPAHVEYNANGTINPDESYIMVQDQRGGSASGYYIHNIDGNTVCYCGRISAKLTFAELLKGNYIPVTTAEFLGEKPYEEGTLSVSQEDCSTIKQLQKATITSNYPLAVVRFVVTAEDGERTVLERILFNGAAKEGVPRSCDLGTLDALKTFSVSKHNKPGSTISIEVIISTGQTFYPISFKI